MLQVQTELRKELDRTLRALRQAEKLRLAGFRIQKALFLKHVDRREKTKRYLTNIPAVTNNSYFNQRVPAQREFCEGGEQRQGFSLYKQNNLNTMRGEDNRWTVNSLQIVHDIPSFDTLSQNMNQPQKKSEKPLGGLGDVGGVNSEWMRTIRQELHQHQTARPDSQNACVGTAPEPATDNSSEFVQKRNVLVLPHIPENKKNMRDNRSKMGKKQIIRIRLSQDDRLNRGRAEVMPHRSFAFHTTLPNVYRSDERTEEKVNDTGIVEGMLALSLDARKQYISTSLRQHKADHTRIVRNPDRTNVVRNSNHTRIVPTPTAGHYNVNQQNNTEAQFGHFPELGQAVSIAKTSKSVKSFGLARNTTQPDPAVKQANETTKARPAAPSSTNNKQQRQTGTRSADRKRSLPAPNPPYLGRSKTHPLDKAGISRQNSTSQKPCSVPGSLERNVTMVFVEDADDSHDAPKSHFDFEAWLAYNRRKRGHTQIFYDKSDQDMGEDSSKQTTETVQNKTRPKNAVRFNFSKTSKMGAHPASNILTFREKSKQWYLNFLKTERNKVRVLYGTNHIHEARWKNRSRGAFRSRHNLLPKIGGKLVSGDVSSTQHISDDSLFLLRESADQKLQRQKDYSQFLQVKVHNFMCS